MRSTFTEVGEGVQRGTEKGKGGATRKGGLGGERFSEKRTKL